MRILAIVLFLTSALFANARSLSSRYSSYPTDGGMLYHFSNKKLSSKTNTKKFEFDITYVTCKDSLIFNYTITTEDPCQVKTTIIKSDGQEYKNGSIATLFRDVKKNHYILRTTATFAFSDIEKMFSANSSPIIDVVLNNNQVTTATYTKSQWKSEKKIISRIINSIKL